MIPEYRCVNNMCNNMCNKCTINHYFIYHYNI